MNQPHSSRMGGVWERMIAVSRRILDSMLSEVHQKNLTHDVLVTFMWEVMRHHKCKTNSADYFRPCKSILLSPSMLLTHKSTADVKPFENVDPHDMYRAQWRLIQYLAEKFWKRWSSKILQTLQKRSKWQRDEPNIKDGDVVLMKQIDLPLGMTGHLV